MDQDMITDITLDHLPDLSDASISFQIPSNNASADLLLADHTDGFDVLCNGVGDYDTSFAPVMLRDPRGPPLTLGELTPRVQATPHSPHIPPSPIPSQVPSSSAKPSVIQRPRTLGNCSPDKPRRTPSSIKSRHRQLESPLASSERFLKLRAEVETLVEEDESPVHVETLVMASAEDGFIGSTISSHVHAHAPSNAFDGPLASEDILPVVPEEKNNIDSPPANQDVAMATGNGCQQHCQTDPMNIAVPEPPPKPRRNPRTDTKPTVADGGISRRTAYPATHVSKQTKAKPPRVKEAHAVLPSAARLPSSPPCIDAGEELVPPACLRGDIDSNKTQITHPNTGGLAERLVSYSQKLISSIGLYKPRHETSGEVVRVADAQGETPPPVTSIPPSLSPERINDIPDTRSKPFRLSEISPHKLPLNILQPGSTANAGILQDGIQPAMSHTRPSRKRVSLDDDQEEDFHRRKRGKVIVADGGSERVPSHETTSQDHPPTKNATHAHENQSLSHSKTRNGTRHFDPSKSTLPEPRTKYKPRLTSSRYKGSALNVFPYTSNSRKVHERVNKGKDKRDEKQSRAASIHPEPPSGHSASSRHRQGKRKQENTAETFPARQRSGPTSTAYLPLIEEPTTTLSVAQPTKPVGFTFRVDARLESRKGEEKLTVSEPGKTYPIHPVPDVRAHRASHRAAYIFHKPEGVVPSVPVVPFFFCTEQRAKEREKFDDMVKRKEEEMQRLKEEQRRREAEEEEKAIKELRRKAIPKANEIPEWYADMPKRKGTAV